MRPLPCLLLVLASCASTPDLAEIDRHIDDWNRAWSIEDPALAAAGYSDDATFTNAFGFQRVGRAAIEAYLTEVFALDFVMAGKSEEVERSVRLLRPDVAAVTSVIERTGQEHQDGSSLGTRRTSHLRVFVRSGDTWLLESHLISDARSIQRPDH